MIMKTEDRFPDDISMDHSIRVDDSTRERITQISMRRKESANSNKKRDERKKEIISATGRWTSDLDGTDSIPSFLANPSDFSSKKKKKRGKPQRRSGGNSNMSLSEHSGRVSLEATDDDNGNYRRATRSRSREGHLGRFLVEAEKTENHSKRRGARTVASMPITRGSMENSHSKSPDRLKQRHRSSNSFRRTLASQGKKRVESPKSGRVKRSNSQGALKKGITRVKSKSSQMESDSRDSHRSNEGKLGQMLGKMEGTKKKKGARSVSSAPSVRAHRTKVRRSSERKQTSIRRSKSSSGYVSDSKGADNSHRPRRSVSVDAPMPNEEEPGSPGSLSQRLSRRLKSLKKFAGISGSGKNNSSAHSRTFRPEQAPTRNGGRPSKREFRGDTKKTRSSSAGPLGGRPQQRRDDRRATLTKIKRSDSAAPNSGGDDDDEGRPSLPMRAQSMMLHRDMTRRGKSNSLADLVKYSEEEIHSTSYFASNHVLVNRERMKRGLRPLTRNIAMDELARKNAEKMAESAGVSAIPATYVGNVLRGESIRAIHKATMQNKDGRERANLLNPYFQDFGVGTSKGEDGMLYVCQLFSERLELTVTDTT